MTCLILAGGKGSRLRRVSNALPKPMMPVAGRPFLEHLLLHLGAQAIKDVVLCTGYRSRILHEYFGDGARWGLRLRYSEEPCPLGTGGALKRALAFLSEETFLAMNGDSLANGDFRKLVDFHSLKGGVGTMGLARVEERRRFGGVEVDGESRIHRFVEKAGKGPGLINSGVYVLSRRAFDFAPERPFSLEGDLFPWLIPLGLYGCLWGSEFVDMGVPEDYRRLADHPPSWARGTSA